MKCQYLSRVQLNIGLPKLAKGVRTLICIAFGFYNGSASDCSGFFGTMSSLAIQVHVAEA